MKDTIIKTLVYDKQVRLFLLDNTAMMNEIIHLNQGNHRVLNVALGKLISGVSLLTATIKGEQRISVTVSMSNPAYKIFADIDAHGNVRGYANESLMHGIDEKSASVQDLIGKNASIRMIKGSNMNQFTGITDMPYQTIDDDLSHYFKQSEQVETFIETNLALNNENTVLGSYAMYAQLLPGAPVHLLHDIREILDTNSSFFQKQTNMDIQETQNELRNYFSDIEIIGQSQVQFSCGCSKEMFYGLLLSLDREDLMEAVDDDRSMDTCCHICGRTYLFQPDEIKSIL
ncbi:Hsp33 family molecular chaperone HslO [Virgibacillus necropolis]|nr:Hsp33 family molecular chaperone HslO [Virgibacillus necropolis]